MIDDDLGAVALDFSGAEPWRTPGELGRWLSTRFLELDAAATDRDLVDALALRSAIAAIAAGITGAAVPRSDDVDVVNLFAATPDIPPALEGGTRQAGRTRARIGQGLSTLAREAIGIFGDEQRERIRQCAAEDCEIVFYDASRSNNRRWCSMRRCGNRAKVRAHRSRAAAPEVLAAPRLSPP